MALISPFFVYTTIISDLVQPRADKLVTLRKSINLKLGVY